jgi:hypothetical protein
MLHEPYRHVLTFERQTLISRLVNAFRTFTVGKKGGPVSLQHLRRQERRRGAQGCPGHNPHDRREKSKKPHLIGETKNQFMLDEEERTLLRRSAALVRDAIRMTEHLCRR